MSQAKTPRWISKRELPEVSVQKPKPGRWIRPYKIRPRETHVLHRRGWDHEAIGITELEMRAVPESQVRGTTEERIVYKELQRRNIPFDFQSSLDGGRLLLGGMVADFILEDRKVIIRVQGSKWHTGFASEHKDVMQRALLEAAGYSVMDFWDWEIHNPELCEEWLRRNIDTGMPSRGGGVVVTGGLHQMDEWRPIVESQTERLDRIEGALFRGIMDPTIQIGASSIQCLTLSSISANLGTVTAGTLIGATMKTSATVGALSAGQGIIINTSHFAAYNSTGDMQFEIDSATGVARTGTSAPYAQLSDEGLLVVNTLGGTSGLKLKTATLDTISSIQEIEGGVGISSDQTDVVKFALYDTAIGSSNLRLNFAGSATSSDLELYDASGIKKFTIQNLYSSDATTISNLGTGDLVLASASAQVGVSNDVEPSVNNTYYLGDYLKGWKGVILYDQTDSKYYLLHLDSGAVHVTEVTS